MLLAGGPFVKQARLVRWLKGAETDTKGMVLGHSVTGGPFSHAG